MAKKIDVKEPDVKIVDKIDWKMVILQKWSYDINMLNIINNVIKNVEGITYQKELYHAVCFAERWANKSGRYYFIIQDMVEDMMLEVILKDGI